MMHIYMYDNVRVRHDHEIDMCAHSWAGCVRDARHEKSKLYIQGGNHANVLGTCIYL